MNKILVAVALLAIILVSALFALFIYPGNWNPFMQQSSTTKTTDALDDYYTSNTTTTVVTTQTSDATTTGETTGEEFSGYTFVRFLLTFADGNTKEIAGSETYFSPSFFTTFEGSELSEFKVQVLMKVLSGTITDWKTTVTQKMEAYLKPNTVPKMGSTGYFDDSDATWAVGELKTISEVSISGSVIDGLISEYGNGDWFFQTIVKVQLTATLNGQETVFVTLNPAGGMDLKYTNGVPVSGDSEITSDGVLSDLFP